MTLDPSTRPDIGIVGLPDVASALRSAGLVVVGGGAFSDVAKAIRLHLDSGPFPILSTTEAAPGLRTWLTTQAGKGVTVGLVPVGGADLAVNGAEVLEVPCAVDDLVCGVGLDPIGGPVGAAEVSLDGSVSDFGAPPAPGVSVAPAGQPSGAESPSAPDPWSDAPPAAAVEPVDDLRVVDHEPMPEPATAPVAEPVLAPTVEPAVESIVESPWPDPPAVTAPAPADQVGPVDPVDHITDDFTDEGADDGLDDDGFIEPIPVPAADDDPWGNESASPVPPVAPSVAAPSPWDAAPAPIEAPAPPTPVPVPASPTPPPPQPVLPDPPAPVVDSAPPLPALPDVAPLPPAKPLDIEDVFDTAVTAPASVADPTMRRQGAADAPVVFVVAGKGGVGKTTMTVQLAQRVGEADLRSVAVDANRGQADITTYLRLGRAGLPTIADAASVGRFEQAVLPAERLNGARHQRLEPVSFAAILGPPPEKSDPRLVTADVYRQAIDLARRNADVVVVDTQIAEATDTSGLIDGLVVPMLAEGAWALAVTDLSSASVRNLHSILSRWRERSVPPDRVLLVVNRADPSTVVDEAELASAFSNVANMVGLVHADTGMIASLNRGAVRYDAPELLQVLDTVLHRVTGFDEFDPALHAVESTSLMDRLRRRRGR